jgi:hypothetical protein
MAPVLNRLRPYIRGVNLGAYYLDDVHRCPACGLDDLEADGWYTAVTTMYAAYTCRSCGAWSRSAHRKHNVGQRAVG